MSLFSNISIRTKIAFAPVLLILSFSVFIYTYYPLKQKEELHKAIVANIHNVSDMITLGVGMGMGDHDVAAVSEALAWARKDSSITCIMVLDTNGTEIGAYNPCLRNAEFAGAKEGFIFQEKDNTIKLSRNIYYQGKYFGRLYLVYSLDSMNASIASLRSTTFFICLGIVLVGALLSFTISYTITNNIRKLSLIANKISKGNTNIKIDVSSNDEIGRFAAAFNNMIQKLNQSHLELLSSKQYTESIIMSMVDSVFVLDEAYNIVTVNHAVDEEFGYNEEELAGKNLSFIFSDKQVAEYYIEKTNENGRVENTETYFADKQGNNIPVLFSTSVVIDDNSQRKGAVCVAQNISDIKRAQKELINYSTKLEKINKELDDFAYVVSHDLKAPLRAIYKLSEWIQEDMANNDNESIPHKMELLRGRVLRMEGLINGILDYSKIGKIKVSVEVVNVGTLLREVIEMIAPPGNFKVTVCSSMPVIKTEKLRLMQVFSNLISNGIRHNDKKDGVINISMAEKEDCYEFSVTDNGPGIEERYHNKIFELFQTLEARDKVESTGIGLTLIKKIVEEKGGRIWVNSEAGMGATFTFSWPK